MKKNIKILILVISIAVLFPLNQARGTIASITVTPANPTNLSNGLSYYLAGMTYDFTVQVIDPDITGWAQLTDVRVTIPYAAGDIELAINPSGTGLNFPVAIVSGTVDAVADVSGSYNNCSVTFNVTIRWDTQQSLTPALRTIVGSATTTNTDTDDANVTYGICSSMRILNFTQDGVASDGMINQYHDGFNVTGVPVYNVTGATAADAIQTVIPGEIANTILYRNGVSTGLSDGSPAALSYAVGANTVTTLGTNTWRVRAVMSTAGGPETSANALTIDCDEVEITGISFANGGGVNTPAYYRSVNVPGTTIQVTARMRNSLSAMVGNTTVRISNYTDGQDIDVVIANGATSGTAVLPNPAAAGLPADPGTLQNYYRAQEIIGGSYGGDAVEGQNTNGRIVQPANPIICWDRNYYPWQPLNPFTTLAGASATAYSITVNWTGLTSSYPNQDFYSYRFYYKDEDDAQYTLIDRNTSGFSYLANSTANTITIIGLKPLTNYNYYITAVDVFGQEVPLAQSLPGTGTFGTIGTLASTIRVELTDGITTYEDNSFANAAASSRPLRATAIRAKVFIVTAGDLPDIVNLIVADNATGNLINGSGQIASVANGGTLVEDDPAGFYRISTMKSDANEWTGYIPDTIPLIEQGSEVKFVIETIKDGTASYADHDSETETPPGDPNDMEYNFSVSIEIKFRPWPTRVLNNVLTDKNPRAYPAYYLTDDAYVSIDVYDVKGRKVRVILDKAFRKGGQNIKEDGWRGDNKSRRKLGVGLYYMHFKAKRASDGKVILDSFKKVVVAK